MKSSIAIRPLALALVAAVLPACLSSNPDRTAPQPEPLQTITTFKAAVLSGRQEVPPVETTGTGNASVSINLRRTEVTVTVEVAGLTDITEAHLHFAPPGSDGPILFPLASGPFTSPLTVTLTQADFHPAPTVQTFEAGLVSIEQGLTYVNVHTAANPDGELRGQVGPVTFTTTLTGLDVVPSVSSAATGTLGVTLSPDQSSMTIVLNQTGLGPATGADIGLGRFGQNGPIIFPLAGAFYEVPLTVSVDSNTLVPAAGSGVSSFNDAVDMMLSGNTYVSINTAANPSGEIRGQILPNP
jgi:trimeric autotransporter adhesin